MAVPALRIACLFVRYGGEKYPEALSRLREYYARHHPSSQPEIVIIDNALPASVKVRVDPSVWLIGGDNTHREFTGWDVGVGHLGPRLMEFDLVHLVTEAFDTLYTSYIDRLDERVVRGIIGRAAVVGHVDYYNQPVSLLGRWSEYWIRSSFVFIPPTELRLLGSLCSLKAYPRLFSGDPAEPFAEGAPVSAQYQRYILDWLTGEGTGQGVTWHSRFELTKESLPNFEAKCLAILNEHALTMRLRSQGCAVIDAHWLATYAGASDDWRLPVPVPRWTHQLAERDTDPVPGLA
jgi:hypothetical protein